MYATTKKGTRVYLCFNEDCDENEGGWWVEIYIDEYGDRDDDFCIHPEDCDCTNMEEVEAYALNYVRTQVDWI